MHPSRRSLMYCVTKVGLTDYFSLRYQINDFSDAVRYQINDFSDAVAAGSGFTWRDLQ